MQTILIVFHLFLAVGLIGLILLQHGKGADMGAAFGSGASGTVFGSKGSASFLTRMTAGLATLFFITSMVMAYFASQRDDGTSVLDQLQQPAAEVEVQPQSDMPPAPAESDMPPVAGDAGVPVAAESDLPVVAAPEDNAGQPAVAADEAPAGETADTTDTAVPAETAPQVEEKQ